MSVCLITAISSSSALAQQVQNKTTITSVSVAQNANVRTVTINGEMTLANNAQMTGQPVAYFTDPNGVITQLTFQNFVPPQPGATVKFKATVTGMYAAGNNYQAVAYFRSVIPGPPMMFPPNADDTLTFPMP